MSERLGDQAFCVDGRYSLADIALGCALGYIGWRFPDLDWKTRHPNLAQHATKLYARQSFADTAPPAA